MLPFYSLWIRMRLLLRVQLPCVVQHPTFTEENVCAEGTSWLLPDEVAVKLV
jgi:hypothetical protein